VCVVVVRHIYEPTNQRTPTPQRLCGLFHKIRTEVSRSVISVVVKLTFSLRRHGVDLIGREHGVIDVQVAAGGAPWLHRGGTHGAHG
jgi:hypothetical protein